MTIEVHDMSLLWRTFLLMNKIKLNIVTTTIVVICCILVVIGGVFFQYIDEGLESQQIGKHSDIARMTTDDISQLKTGDLIFRKGYGMISQWVSVYLERGPFDLTHAGIVIVLPSGVFVAHALSSKQQHIDGVILQPIEQFLQSSYPDKLLIARWTNYRPEMDELLLSSINAYIHHKIPFDKEADYDNSDALYCNEMIVNLWINELGLISSPKSSAEKKYLFHNLSVLYNTSQTEIIFSTFQP